MPVFECLLPNEYNDDLMDLLFNLAHWHALAKLRQHTDLSLNILESVTIQLGQSLRQFQETTCLVYKTQELKREQTARLRKSQSKSAASKIIAAPSSNANDVVMADAEGVVAETSTPPCSSKAKTDATPKKPKLRKTLNLNTYKDHSLGDYVETIRRYGTVDSYSTELVNLCIIACYRYSSTPLRRN